MKSITAGLALAIAACAVGSPSKSTITKVTSTNVGGGVEIAVAGESLATPKTFFANSAKTLYVVQFNAAMTPEPGRIQVGAAGVDYVRYARFQSNPPVSRLVLHVEKGIVPVVTSEEGTWYVRIGVVPQTKGQVLGNDDAEMARAIEQLKNPAGAYGNEVLTGKPQTKLEALQIPISSGNNALRPGTIIGFESKAGFTDSEPNANILPSPKVPTSIGSPYKDTKISVTLEQANILAILKSFADQTDVNIVAAPDVSPVDKPLLLSLSLKNVDLDFAMTTVTSLAELTFTRVGNTYVVSRTDDFASKVAPIVRAQGEKYETRVVDIASGEGRQIREATLQAIPQAGPDGYYEIIDPMSAVYEGNPTTDTTANNAGANNAGGAAAGTNPTTTVAAPDKRARYVMLIGEPRRLDIIESFVRDLDNRIADSFSLSGAANYGSVVVPIVSGQTQKIKDLLGSMLETNPRKGDYSIEETSIKELAQGEESLKMLLIAGPKDELNVLKSFADNLDASMCELKGIERNTDPEAFKQFYEVVDLKFVEPTHAAFDLKNRVRGLYVTILPDPVTPGIKGEDQSKKQETGDAGAAAGGAAASTPQTTELKREVGHEQMRLVLRGTRAQIDEAKEYLQSVDIPARQVALELRVMELTKSDALKLGLDWSILTGGRLTSFRMNQGFGTSPDVGGVFTGEYQDNATTNFSVTGMLDSIANKQNLIARPNALVSDGRSSHLFIGDTIRYVKMINASQNGTTVEIDEVEVGVTVDVDARIGADGNLAFNLKQNFSILNGFTPVPGGGQIPQTSDRMAEMFINMRDGETLALGGLILDQDRKSVSGIPILKDLPLIGELFKRTNNSKQRTEIVFFLTAKVVDNTNKATAADPHDDGGAPTAPPAKGKGN